MKNKRDVVIQSYELTTAIYDFNVYEKRIMYRLIELIQDELYNYINRDFEGKLSYLCDGDILKVELPLKTLLKSKTDKNYQRVKDALVSLQKKTIQYEDEKIWRSFNVISDTSIDKETGIVTFYLHKYLYECCSLMAKGYSKFNLKNAFNLNSAYAMRLYELIANQKGNITYEIDYIKMLWCLDAKYLNNSDFIRWAFTPLQQEINKKTEINFDFDIIKEGRRFKYITIKPILQEKQLQQQLCLSWSLDSWVINYLKHNLYFTTNEIKANLKTFMSIQDKIGSEKMIMRLNDLKTHSNGKKNPKGYIVTSLKNQLKGK